MYSKTRFLPFFVDDGFVCNFQSERWQTEYELNHRAQSKDMNYVNKNNALD